MSQVLNCTWVLLSIWVFVSWLCRSSRRGISRRLQLFGLTCGLALLFPVISDNDDLLQQQLLNAPVSPVLKSFVNVKVACDTGVSAVGPPVCALFPARAVHELISSGPNVLHSGLSVGATGDRSPPRLS